MQRKLFFKFLTIGSLMLLLLVPLSMIGGVIKDRQYHRTVAYDSIAQSWTGEQQLQGAMIVVPYQKRVMEDVDVYEKTIRQTVTVQKERTYQRYKYILPETLNVNGRIDTEERYRGIYKVPVYTAKLKIAGQFKIKNISEILLSKPNITWQKPYMVFGVSDVRGVGQSVKLKINGKEGEPHPGTKTPFIKQGVHANIIFPKTGAAKFDFDMDLELKGMKRLSFLPVGKSTKVQLASPWKHPQFEGRFLPKTREISEDGFTADWQTSIFSSNVQQNLDSCINHRKCHEFWKNTFGVSLYHGVDIYLQAERSIKYALLFVGLTFCAFFLFEVIKGLQVHVVQYGLIGAALAIFYLLLVSLSEHISFVLSYIIAGLSCAGLIGFYVSFVLKSIIRGGVFAGTLLSLYAVLYMLIRSEDYSLLMGGILLFGILAFIMISTRHIDWYAVGEKVSEKSKIKEPIS